MKRRLGLLYASFWLLAHMEYAHSAPDSIATGASLPLRNVLIEVRQVQTDESQRSTAALENPAGAGLQMNQSRNSATTTQQALVLNGRPVRLMLQTTSPIRLLQSFVRNGRVVTTASTVLLETGTGFIATPRWDGGPLVELELAAQQTVRGDMPPSGGVAQSSLSSMLVVPLDEWTTVGESEQSNQSSRSNLAGGQVQNGLQRTGVQVRISLR